MNKQSKQQFLKVPDLKGYLTLNLLMSAIYLGTLVFAVARGDPMLFTILLVGELFHLWQSVTFAKTIWDVRPREAFNARYKPSVAVFITVCGETEAILEPTVAAAAQMNYPNFRVYILNDGYARNEPHWRDALKVAEKYHATVFNRRITTGAKAGNINNALAKTGEEFFLVLDADHIPRPEFLHDVMGYFVDPDLGFVQTPQYYANHQENFITKMAWEQQTVFFGPILQGKNRLNSAFMCGTNMVIRRSAIETVGGMCETNIAEDFVTSLFIHEQGWKSIYVPKVLAEGLAPVDFGSYYKQQYRWARGSLEVLFKFNPLFRSGLSFDQKIQYLASASFYMGGIIVLIDFMLPIAFFFTGRVPIVTDTMQVALIFLPYILVNILILQKSANYSFSFKALSLAISSFPIHITALVSTLLGKKQIFQVTSKEGQSGTHLSLASWHLAYMLLAVIGFAYAYSRSGFTASLASNVSWVSLNFILMFPYIFATLEINPAKIRNYLVSLLYWSRNTLRFNTDVEIPWKAETNPHVKYSVISEQTFDNSTQQR